jgi:hypothetical protein
MSTASGFFPGATPPDQNFYYQQVAQAPQQQGGTPVYSQVHGMPSVVVNNPQPQPQVVYVQAPMHNHNPHFQQSFQGQVGGCTACGGQHVCDPSCPEVDIDRGMLRIGKTKVYLPGEVLNSGEFKAAMAVWLVQEVQNDRNVQTAIVELVKFLQNIDAQKLTVKNDTISLENGGSVDVSEFPFVTELNGEIAKALAGFDDAYYDVAKHQLVFPGVLTKGKPKTVDMGEPVLITDDQQNSVTFAVEDANGNYIAMSTVDLSNLKVVTDLVAAQVLLAAEDIKLRADFIAADAVLKAAVEAAFATADAANAAASNAADDAIRNGLTLPTGTNLLSIDGGNQVDLSQLKAIQDIITAYIAADQKLRDNLALAAGTDLLRLDGGIPVDLSKAKSIADLNALTATTTFAQPTGTLVVNGKTLDISTKALNGLNVVNNNVKLGGVLVDPATTVDLAGKYFAFIDTLNGSTQCAPFIAKQPTFQRTGWHTFDGDVISFIGTSTKMAAGLVPDNATDAGQFLYGDATPRGGYTITNKYNHIIQVFPGGGLAIGSVAPTPNTLTCILGAEKPGGGAWATLSDQRIKKDVVAYAPGLSAVEGIETVTYKFNGENNIPEFMLEKTFVGVIAQQLQLTLPEAIGSSRGEIGGKEAEVLNVNNDYILFALVNAVKELSATVKAQAERLAAIEAVVQA